MKKEAELRVKAKAELIVNILYCMELPEALTAIAMAAGGLIGIARSLGVRISGNITESIAQAIQRHAISAEQYGIMERKKRDAK